MNASDVLIECLLDWGVEIVFGLPGDGINGIMEVTAYASGQNPLHPCSSRRGGRIHGMRLRQVHGQARCMSCHLRARRHSPVERPLRRQDGRRAGAGDHRAAISRSYRHAHPAGCRARQACSWMSASSTSASWAPRTWRTWSTWPAVRRSSYRGVAHITIPVDFQEKEVHEREALEAQHPGPHQRRCARTATRFPPKHGSCSGSGHPQPGKKVAILAGRGALGAGDELSKRSRRRWARPSSRRCWARPWCPTTALTPPAASDCWAPRRRRRRWKSATPCSWSAPRFRTSSTCPSPGRRKGVQIDIDPMRIGLRYPVDVGLVGDSSAPYCSELMPLLKKQDDRSFLEKAQAGMKEWWELIEKRVHAAWTSP